MPQSTRFCILHSVTRIEEHSQIVGGNSFKPKRRSKCGSDQFTNIICVLFSPMFSFCAHLIDSYSFCAREYFLKIDIQNCSIESNIVPSLGFLWFSYRWVYVQISPHLSLLVGFCHHDIAHPHHYRPLLCYTSLQEKVFTHWYALLHRPHDMAGWVWDCISNNILQALSSRRRRTDAMYWKMVWTVWSCRK